MTFDELVPHLKQLIGKPLSAIGKGAGVTITGIDLQTDRIFLDAVGRGPTSRPLSELRRLWEKLVAEPAVHVDSALGGSGSSRNQPETILAALPFVEWAHINGRKHVVWVKANTHVPGTLRQMDPLRVVKLKSILLEFNEQSARVTIFVITDNMADSGKDLQRASGRAPSPFKGGYRSVIGNVEVLLCDVSNASSLPIGAYPVLPLAALAGNLVSVAGDSYTLVGIGKAKVLVKA